MSSSNTSAGYRHVSRPLIWPLLLASILLSGCNTYFGRFFTVNKPTITTDKLFPGVELPRPPQDSIIPYPSITNVELPPMAAWAQLKDGTVASSLEALADDTGMAALLIMQDGELVYERYFNGNAPDSLQLTFSLSKSYVATLVGMAIDRGYIPSLDVPVARYLPEFHVPEK